VTPAAPATVSRDDAGRVALRAVRLEAALHVDGRLEEPMYSAVPAVSDLRQQEPVEGAAGHREDRVLGVLRPGSPLRVGALLGERHAGSRRQRDAA
jgi:hypothetical protein